MLCKCCKYNVAIPYSKICGVCKKLGYSWRIFK